MCSDHPPDPNFLGESPNDRLEKFRRNRTKSLENQNPNNNNAETRIRNASRNREALSRNSVEEDSVQEPKKPYSKRKRSPTGKLMFSRRVPAAALTNKEYREKRGLVTRYRDGRYITIYDVI